MPGPLRETLTVDEVACRDYVVMQNASKPERFWTAEWAGGTCTVVGNPPS